VDSTFHVFPISRVQADRGFQNVYGVQFSGKNHLHQAKKTKLAPIEVIFHYPTC
jgi:hypothetical protein